MLRTSDSVLLTFFDSRATSSSQTGNVFKAPYFYLDLKFKESTRLAVMDRCPRLEVHQDMQAYERRCKLIGE
jgi:hypothetical protein